MNLLKKIKENKLLMDMINVMIGIVILILVILVVLFPTNKIILMGVFLLGGLMNIMNGLKLYKDKKKQSMGMSLIMIGAIIFFIGIVVIKTS